MKFTIDKKDYELYALWDEIPLWRAIKAVEAEFDEEDFKELMITEDIFWEAKYTKYQREVLSALSSCPMELLEATDPVHIAVLFDHVKYILSSLHYQNFENYKPKGLTEIKFKGIKYSLPVSISVNGEEILCYKEQSRNVLESSNLVKEMKDLKEKGIKMLPLLCAIYWREDEMEEYNEEDISKRAELFKELPLSVAMDTFFFIYHYYISYLLSSRIYSALQTKGKKKTKTFLLGSMQWPKLRSQEIHKKLKSYPSGN